MVASPMSHTSLDETPREAVSVLTSTFDGEQAWSQKSFAERGHTVSIPALAAAELRVIAEDARRRPLPVLFQNPHEFDIPNCRSLMLAVKKRLEEGVGIAVLRMPESSLTSDESLTLQFWILGRLLSRPVAGKRDGTILYDVRDTGRPFGNGVRGTETNMELAFHTDNSFGLAVPDYVGLLCLRQAEVGGASRFCSIYSIHNDMLLERPNVLHRLYECVYFDRQGAHHAEDSPTLYRPIFSYRHGQLTARLAPGLVRRGYKMQGVDMDDRLIEALEYLERKLADPKYWTDYRLERGNVQYINNRWGAHYRSEFESVGGESRHMVRVWYRESGHASYDGQE